MWPLTGEDAAMTRRAFRVYYSSNAFTHYLDLAKQEVEITGDEAELELDGQRVRCLIEGIGEWAPDQYVRIMPTLYLQRKQEERHSKKKAASRMREGRCRCKNFMCT
jgi:hypothetical protein